MIHIDDMQNCVIGVEHHYMITGTKPKYWIGHVASSCLFRTWNRGNVPTIWPPPVTGRTYKSLTAVVAYIKGVDQCNTLKA